MAFGQRLRQLRQKQGLRQQDLAVQLQVSKPTISAYENETREPGLKMCQKMAHFFNVSLDDLVGDKPSVTQTIDLKMLLNSKTKLTYDKRPLSKQEVERIKQTLDKYDNNGGAKAFKMSKLD
ncbi:MAG: helix-turn-helix domain-containing protein [Aerococcus sp.]|nr:helix-turn-helix domain-containing protein [Aerococcus sp.]